MRRLVATETTKRVRAACAVRAAAGGSRSPARPSRAPPAAGPSAASARTAALPGPAPGSRCRAAGPPGGSGTRGRIPRPAAPLLADRSPYRFGYCSINLSTAPPAATGFFGYPPSSSAVTSPEIDAHQPGPWPMKTVLGAAPLSARSNPGSPGSSVRAARRGGTGWAVPARRRRRTPPCSAGRQSATPPCARRSLCAALGVGVEDVFQSVAAAGVAGAGVDAAEGISRSRWGFVFRGLRRSWR